MRYDVVVAGLGAMGSAAAYQLAKAGVSVLGLDRYHPPHALGSTHGDTRITRVAVGEGLEYVPLVRRSHEIWREIEQRGRGRDPHPVRRPGDGAAPGELRHAWQRELPRAHGGCRGGVRRGARAARHGRAGGPVPPVRPRRRRAGLLRAGRGLRAAGARRRGAAPAGPASWVPRSRSANESSGTTTTAPTSPSARRTGRWRPRPWWSPPGRGSRSWSPSWHRR